MKPYRLFLLFTFVCAFIVVSCSDDPTPTSAPPTPTPVPVKPLADIILHAGPGFGYEEVTRAPKSTPVALLGMARGSDCANWVLVRTSDGDEGWVAPILVNVDDQASIIPPVPTPTPVSSPVPTPSACGAGLALVIIDNKIGKTLEVYLAGPEPAFVLSLDDGETRHLCLAPGEYCYDLTDGEKHDQGDLSFKGGQCTCWHWGGSSEHRCDCSTDPNDYQRP